MQNETVARRYASAAFELASEAGGIAEAGRDLAAARDALFGSEDVRRFFLSPVFQRSDKLRLVREALAGKLDDIAFHTVLLLVRKRREALLPAIVSAYQEFALAAQEKEPLEILSARELDPKEVADIVARVSRASGKSFEVTERIDPRLLGGVCLTLGDVRVDGSIAGRLAQLARDLSTNALEKASPQ